MRNIKIVDQEKMAKNATLEESLASLEELFLRKQDEFIAKMKEHEEQYADANSWLTNKRDENYLMEKMKMTLDFYRTCEAFISAMKAEELLVSDILVID
jgi:hypothetical protein